MIGLVFLTVLVGSAAALQVKRPSVYVEHLQWPVSMHSIYALADEDFIKKLSLDGALDSSHLRYGLAKNALYALKLPRGDTSSLVELVYKVYINYYASSIDGLAVLQRSKLFSPYKSDKLKANALVSAYHLLVEDFFNGVMATVASKFNFHYRSVVDETKLSKLRLIMMEEFQQQLDANDKGFDDIIGKYTEDL